MPALDVLGVRAVVERLPVIRQRHRRLILDEAVGRRQQDGPAVRGREIQRVVPIPLVDRSGWSLYRGLAAPAAPAAADVEPEHDVVACEAHVRGGIEGQVAWRVVPDLFRLARHDICLPDRPGVAALEGRARQPGDLLRRRVGDLRGLGARRRSGATATAASCRSGCGGVCSLLGLRERITRPPHEHDAPALGRPHGVRVEVDAWRHVGHRPRGHVVDDDVAVVGARADERDSPAVGRPRRRALDAPRGDERPLAAVHLLHRPDRRDSRAIDLAVLHEEYRAAVRRQGVAAGGKLHHAERRSASRARGPHGALGAVRIRRRVRHPAVTVWCGPAHERHHRAVVRDLDRGHVDPVVLEETREADGRKRGRGGRVGVAFAFFERHPRHAVGLPRRDQFERGRGAEEPLVGWDRRRPGRRRCLRDRGGLDERDRERARGHDEREADEAHAPSSDRYGSAGKVYAGTIGPWWPRNSS